MHAPVQQLNNASALRFPPISWKLLLKIAACCIGLAYSVLTLKAANTRTTISICTKCGMYETTTERCFPFTSIAFRRSDTQSQTPISLVVQKHQLQLFHRHQFVIATNQGRHQEPGPAAILKERVNPPFSTFIDTLATYSDPITTEKWLERALNPDCYFPFAMAGAHEPLPTNQSEFNTWWQRVLTEKFSNTDLAIVFVNDSKTWRPPRDDGQRLPKTSSSGQDKE